MMFVHKLYDTSNIVLNSSVALFFFLIVMVFSYGMELSAQNTDKKAGLSENDKVEIKSFMDSNYQRLSNFRNIRGDKQQVHPFSGNESQCDRCHEVHRTSGGEASYILFRENSARLLSGKCLECHPMSNNSHPTLIKPKIPIPKDFPLSDNNELTCISCHNPHYQRFSTRAWLPRTHLDKVADIFRRKKQFKTYYLRRNNSKKELCLACHQGISQHWGFYNQP
ncbi:hypothetical protein ACFL6H_04780 [Candidatus Latescibacterota bacterium]